MIFQIDLIEIGRAKVNRQIVCICPKLEHAERQAYAEADKHLMSNTSELRHVKGNEYAMYVGGFRKVGSVFITEVNAQEASKLLAKLSDRNKNVHATTNRLRARHPSETI